MALNAAHTYGTAEDLSPGTVSMTDAAKRAGTEYGSNEGWEAGSRSARLVMLSDMALQILCHQIQRDYATFLKRHVLSRIPAERRLNVAERNCLIALGAFARPMRGSEVAQALRSTPATASRALAGLVGAGLAEQADCPEDARATCNMLSEAGRAHYDEVMHLWRLAIAKAEMVSGQTLSEDAFATALAAFHTVKDRAFAYANYKPGRLGVYAQGISRPAHADRHAVATAFPLKDSYLRFYAQMASRDYLGCLSKRAINPLLKGKGIGVRELRVLMCIDYYVRPGADVHLSQAEIATVMRFDTATVARATAGLQAGGYVSLESDPDDDRLQLLAMTEAGRSLAGDYRERCQGLADRIDAHYGMGQDAASREYLLSAVTAIRNRAAVFADLKRLPEADPILVRV